MYGVSPRSLTYFEEQGVLCSKIEGGVRYYSSKDKLRLEIVLKAKKLGFSLLETKMLIASAEEQTRDRDVQQSSQDEAPVQGRDISEQIWQTEKQIELLRLHIQALYVDLKAIKKDDQK